MDQEEIDKVVLAYLDKRGFKQAGLAFQQEKQQNSKGSNTSSTAQIDPDIAKQILAFSEYEEKVDGPVQYQEGYSKLRSWAYSSLDQYQHELVRVLYPVFIHGFMDLVAKGHIQEARTFFNSFRGDHEVAHSRELQKLEGVLSPSHLEEMEFAHSLRQSKVSIKICQELMEKLQTPSDAKLMKIAIDDLNNLSLSLEDRHRALQELLILVEPIDNANDLHKLGGLMAVIRELDNPNTEIRTISAWILGKASQNNLFVQNQILELGTLAKLMQMASSDFTEEATKALYALSALIRNNLKGQELFYMEAGHLMLQNILSNSSTDIRLRRKSVFLLADLVECQLDSRNNAELPFFSNHVLLKSVVNLMASEDLDLQEKALYAVKNLLLLRSSNALVFKDVCELDVVLGRMKQQLQQSILDDKFKEYALDVENLRREVELIFLGKLDKVKPVST